jgi:hypothetical protein
MQNLDDAYTKAKKYIYQNSIGVNFTDIVENTDIPEKALSYLLNQGRIVLGSKTGSGLKCRVCGKEADAGVLCSRCRAKLSSENLFSLASGSGEKEHVRAGTKILPLTKK